MRFLAVCPRRFKRGATIITTTAFRVRFLSLDGIYRRVEIDPVRRVITVYRRYVWFFRWQREIDFEDVEAVTYGYRDLTSGSWIGSTHESRDCFTVGLRLRDDSELVLHRFRGDGTLVNDSILPDWIFNPFGFELSGNQEQESRDYVELVSRLVGVTTIPHRGF